MAPMNIDRRGFLAAAAGAALAGAAQPARAAVSDDTLNQLAAAAARAGSILWYESSPRDQIDRVIAAFTQRFPAVRLEHVRDTGGNAMAGRIIQEVQGNTRTCDIGTNSASVIWQLVGRNMVERVDWAARGPDARLAPTPFTLLTTASTYVILSNSRMVSDADAPRTWEDLANPRWREKFGTWIRSEGLTSLAAVWGEERVARYIEQLNAQRPFLFKSTFPLAQQLAAGEVAVALGIYHTAQPPIRRGAPIRVTVPDPAAISSLFSFLPTAGRNKDGGLLLALWLATPGGAQAYEQATGRGNYLIEGTETARLLAGRTVAEFTPDQTERMLPILTRFNNMLQNGGGREVD